LIDDVSNEEKERSAKEVMEVKQEISFELGHEKLIDKKKLTATLAVKNMIL
jgi:hypothetical protein